MDIRSLTVRVPAKLNLFLEIVRRRDDGFHEIDSLMAPISLRDQLSFHWRDDEQVRLQCTWNDAADGAEKNDFVENPASGSGVSPCDGTSGSGIPCDERNLVVQAIRAVLTATGRRDGFDITLVKRIPVESGLGGGSADAAATLVAVNRLCGAPLSTAELAGLAAKLGSDVPFFLAGGVARCGGRGEILEPVTGPAQPLHFVLIRPADGFSTATAYRLCRPAAVSGDRRKIDEMLDAWTIDDPQRIGAALFNRFEPIVAAHSAGVRKTLERLRREPVCGAGMSGSGTCCFALCHDAEQAMQLARQLATEFPDARRIAAVSCPVAWNIAETPEP